MGNVKLMCVVVLLTIFLSWTTAMPNTCINDSYRILKPNTEVEICADGVWLGVVCHAPNDSTNEMDNTQSPTQQITPSMTVCSGQLLTVTETIVITTLANNCKAPTTTIMTCPSCHSDMSTNDITLASTEFITMTTSIIPNPSISLTPTPDVATIPPATGNQMNALAPYIAVIVLLFSLLMVTFVGWACTCVVMRRKTSYTKQRRQNSYNLQTHCEHDNTVHHEEFNQTQVETSFNSGEDLLTPLQSNTYSHHSHAYEQVTTNHGVKHMYDVIDHDDGETNGRERERERKNTIRGHHYAERNIVASQGHSVQGHTQRLQDEHGYQSLEPMNDLATNSRGEMNSDPGHSVQRHTGRLQDEHGYQTLERMNDFSTNPSSNTRELNFNPGHSVNGHDDHDYYTLEPTNETDTNSIEMTSDPNPEHSVNGHDDHDYYTLEPTNETDTNSIEMTSDPNPEHNIQRYTDDDDHTLEPTNHESTNTRQSEVEHDYYELENIEQDPPNGAGYQTNRYIIITPSQHSECKGDITNSRVIATGMNFDPEGYKVPNPSQTIIGNDNGGYDRLRH